MGRAGWGHGRFAQLCRQFPRVGEYRRGTAARGVVPAPDGVHYRPPPADCLLLRPMRSRTAEATLGVVLVTAALVLWPMLDARFASKPDSDRLRHFLYAFLPALSCVGLLLAAVRTAETIGRERQQQTLDSLLTTDLSSSEILSQK